MHKVTTSKIKEHKYTQCVCILDGMHFLLTGRRWYFMLGRRGHEPSGRCSCSAGGAVMQPSLSPPSSCRRCSWAANDLARPQLFAPTIVPPRNSNLPHPSDLPGPTFSMQCRREVTEKHGEQVCPAKKNIKTSKIRLYSLHLQNPTVNEIELFIFCKKAKAHYSQIDLLFCSFKTSFLLFKTSTTMIKICDFATLLCGNKVSQNATTVSSENEDRKRAAKRFEFPSCWWLLWMNSWGRPLTSLPTGRKKSGGQKRFGGI